MRQGGQRRVAWWVMLAVMVSSAVVRLVSAEEPQAGALSTTPQSRGYVLTARFLAVPPVVLKELKLDFRDMQTTEVAATGAACTLQAADGRPAEAEYISKICEVVTAKRERELEQWIANTPECRTLSETSVGFQNGESVEVPCPTELVSSGGNLRIRYSRSFDTVGDGQLKYWLTTPRYKLKLEEGAAAEFKRWRMKDARVLKAGEKLLLDLGVLRPQSSQPELLLVLLQLTLEPLKQAAEHDTDGPLVAHKPDTRRLVTISYPVPDLVTPLSAQSRDANGFSTASEPDAPRFDPLVQLLERRVSPELWDDPRKSGCTIRAYPQRLSLIIRAEQATHDQIANCLIQLRAEQNQRLMISVRLITAEDVQRWIDSWNASADEEASGLAQLLESTDLTQGVIVNREQATLIKDLARKPGLVNVNQPMIRRVFYHRQSAGFDFSRYLKIIAPLECRIQLRPVIQSQGQVLVALSVNPGQAEDPLSHVKTGTIPAGHSLLVDITDQLTGEGPTLLPYQLQRQTPDAAGGQRRFLLLVTPSGASQFTPRFISLPSR
ncbi:hypothetical protein Pan153_58230 [Gimesia panareensis]|uniref:Uncharacterized protein n=1 Tax=Gimesia panareensis TaxID=2527978 RepID=A0A518FXV4_9PLAN|nr:hypothetical protein [Gimesia panareensis]QDV21141.1 hypothetical protein Pan153_58230 [Gimesia panareensis]